MRFALLVLLLLAFPFLATAEEKIVLGFQVEAGDRYAVEKTEITRSVTVTDVDGDESTEEETEKSVVQHVLEVLEVADDGNLSLRFSTESGVIESSGAQGYKLSIRRSETGVKHVEVEATGSGLEADALQKVLETLGANLLDLKVDFEMTRQGEIVSSQIEGSLFDNLPQDDDVLVLVGKILKALLPAEEFASAAVADGFPLLPEEAVAVGATWPVRRNLDVMGMSLAGEGTGRVIALESGVACLEEKQTYQVDPSGLANRITGMLSILYEQMGVQATTEMSFDPVTPVEVKAVTWFDVEDGFPVKSTWETFRVELDGLMEITGLGETSTAGVSVQSESEVQLVWKKLP